MSQDFTREIRKLKYERARAWRAYYSAVRTIENLTQKIDEVDLNLDGELKTAEKEIPSHVVELIKDLMGKLRHSAECIICLEAIQPNTLFLTNCGHFFCKKCIEDYKKTENGKTCPTCRKSIFH